MSQSRFLAGSLALGLCLLLSTFLAAQQPQVFQQQPRPTTQPTPSFPPAAAPAPRPATPQPRPTAQPQQPATTTAPATPSATPAVASPAPATPMQGGQAPVNPPPATGFTFAGMSLQNVSLTEVIDMLARELKINYILDPRVRGGVTLNTYGEVKAMDQRSLLDTILRINNAAMVKVGDIYRIVPLADAARLPMEPQVDRKAIPADDQVMLNLVFLKYASADELLNVLKPFIGEGAVMYSYPPANLLFILDSNRNMRRTMQLISLFDDQTMASQRIRAYEVKNSRPSEFIKELEQVFKAISLSDKGAPIRFLGLDRINTVIAIASNPGAFQEVEKWIDKLDVPVKITAGSIDNFVYRVKYGRAESLATAIMSLYGGYPGGGYGGSGGPYGGGGGFGGGFGGGAFGGGGYGGGGYGGGYGNPYGAGGGAYGNFTPPYASGAPASGVAVADPNAAAAGGAATGAAVGAAAGTAAVAGVGSNLTGSYMGAANMNMAGMPRIIPRPEDNSILIQASPQQYASISKLLDELDVSPRQVLIEAKIYEVSLSGAFSSGVTAYLQQRGAGQGTNPSGASLPTFKTVGSLAGGAVNLTSGFLIGQSRELLAFLNTQEVTTRAKVISAPQIIATDSIGASINVGEEVPTLTAQAVTGVQSGGTSLFANSVSNRNTGVTLNIRSRITPSGIVTMEIQQEVSAPLAPAAGGIQSPSFSKRSIQTQVTVQDGDTIAIGGIILEDNSSSVTGIPLLTRIPVVGGIFGNKSYSRNRTELIIFLTPKVIYDTNQIQDATDELKSKLRRLQKVVR